MVDVLTGAERCRRRTPQEKITIVQQTFEPGMTISYIARLHDVNANQLFKWRKQFQEGSLTAVTASEDVVLASELPAAIKLICSHVEARRARLKPGSRRAVSITDYGYPNVDTMRLQSVAGRLIGWSMN